MGKVLLVIALILGACGGSDREGPATDSAVGVRAAGCSLVDGFGTGVAVAPDLVATSAHTVAGAGDVTVIDQSGSEQLAAVVGFDPRQDVAILRVGTPLPHAILGEVAKGDSGVLTTWHPDDGFNRTDISVTRLLRVTIEDIYLDELSERLAFEIEAEVVGGDSGGPVFTQDGDVAGIVYARSRERDGVGFVLRSSEISLVLAAVGVQPVENGRCVR